MTEQSDPSPRQPGTVRSGSFSGGKPMPSIQHEDDPERIWTILDEGNRYVVARTEELEARASLLERLAEGQRPRAAVLACADSRIAPEIFFRREPGDLFVIRTAGQVAGPSAIGSVEYAVTILEVPLVVIIGHELCGAITTVAKPADPKKPAGPGLARILALIRPAFDATPAHLPLAERISLAARENVRKAWRDILEGSPPIREAFAAGKIGVVHAIHDVRTGRIARI